MTRRHQCPYCRCVEDDGVGDIDVTAPFYRLVLAVDRIAWDEELAARRARRARKEAS